MNDTNIQILTLDSELYQMLPGFNSYLKTLSRAEDLFFYPKCFNSIFNIKMYLTSPNL